ncbi:MAG: hypothetical protein J2P29_10950 [Actinobacteria bacterium]|nr:hypothetical protein [Actinomycetota bacterium]
MDMKMLWTAGVPAVIAMVTLAGCNSAGRQGLPGTGLGASTPAGSTAIPASSQPRSPAPTDAGSVLTAGKLTLRAPTGWRITASDGMGDYVISTTACDATDHSWGARCPAVLVLTATKTGLGGAGIGVGNEGQSPYDPSRPYYPSSGVLPCPQFPSAGALMGSSRSSFAPMAGRTANYTVWPFTCNDLTTGAHLGSFEQRDWYLPVSKVLIVDQYQTPGLATVLKDASLL